MNIDLSLLPYEIADDLPAIGGEFGKMAAMSKSHVAARIEAFIASRVSASAAPTVPVEYMTDDELRAAAEFHRAEAARYSNEGAKVWRLRLRLDGGTDGDKQRLAELQAYRAAPASPVALQDEAETDSCPHWREGDSDSCILCGDDLGPTTDADVAAKPSGAARAAAKEIDALLVPLRDYAKTPGISELAAIIQRHCFPAAAESVGRDVTGWAPEEFAKLNPELTDEERAKLLSQRG